MALYTLAVPAHVAAAPDGVIGDVDAFCAYLETGVFARAWDGLHARIMDRLDDLVRAECHFYGNHQPPDARDEDLIWP